MKSMLPGPYCPVRTSGDIPWKPIANISCMYCLSHTPRFWLDNDSGLRHYVSAILLCDNSTGIRWRSLPRAIVIKLLSKVLEWKRYRFPGVIIIIWDGIMTWRLYLQYLVDEILLRNAANHALLFAWNKEVHSETFHAVLLNQFSNLWCSFYWTL